MSLEGAQAAIGCQFPDVDVRDLTLLGAGWEFDVYGTRDGWAFRFPRKSQHAVLFEKEERVLTVVRPVLAGLVELPRVELRGRPCGSFPYSFAGHRTLGGVSADMSPKRNVYRTAAEIGVALSRLHAIPEPEGRAAGLKVEPDGCAEWLSEGRAVAKHIRGLAPIVDVGANWVEGVAEVPAPYRGPLRVIHNDLKPEHLLVDPESGGLVGVLDWTDTGLGDPALDFIGFIPWRGHEFLDAVLEAYELSLDREFWSRVAFLSRVLSLVWLGESLERGLDCRKDMEWVRNAFARVD